MALFCMKLMLLLSILFPSANASPTQSPPKNPPPQVSTSLSQSDQFTTQPSTQPSEHSSLKSSYHPSVEPSSIPTTSEIPSAFPSEFPSSYPSGQPSGAPSSVPSTSPSVQPSGTPSSVPSVAPITIAIDVIGRSGKFIMFNEETGKENDPNKVSVQLEYLYEIAADGVTQVGKSGKHRHSVETFANQDFIIEDPMDTTLGIAVELEGHGNTTFSPVEAQKISFKSSVHNVGFVTVDTYIMKANGVLASNSGEIWKVKTNDVKFNIALSEWEFCNPCGKGPKALSSEFIDIAIEIKGTSDIISQEQKKLVYNLGGNIPLSLSNMVEVDGQWQKMPEGYPKIESQDSKTLFIFRFPKFTNKAVYDPIVGMGELNPTSSPTSRPQIEMSQNPSLSPPSLPTESSLEPTTIQHYENQILNDRTDGPYKAPTHVVIVEVPPTQVVSDEPTRPNVHQSRAPAPASPMTSSVEPSLTLITHGPTSTEAGHQGNDNPTTTGTSEMTPELGRSNSGTSGMGAGEKMKYLWIMAVIAAFVHKL